MSRRHKELFGSIRAALGRGSEHPDEGAELDCELRRRTDSCLTGAAGTHCPARRSGGGKAPTPSRGFNLQLNWNQLKFSIENSFPLKFFSIEFSISILSPKHSCHFTTTLRVTLEPLHRLQQQKNCKCWSYQRVILEEEILRLEVSVCNVEWVAMLQSQSYLEKGTINQLQSPTSSCSLDIYFSFTKDISNPKYFKWSFPLGQAWPCCSEVTAGTWIPQKTKSRLAWASQPPHFGNSRHWEPPEWSRRCQCPFPAVPGLQGAALPSREFLFQDSRESADPTLRQFDSFILDGAACPSVILWISHRNAFLDCFKDALGTCNPGRKSSRDCTFPSAIHFKKSQV